MHSLSISYLVGNLRIYLFLFPNLIQKLFWGRWFVFNDLQHIRGTMKGAF